MVLGAVLTLRPLTSLSVLMVAVAAIMAGIGDVLTAPFEIQEHWLPLHRGRLIARCKSTSNRWLDCPN